MAEPKFETARIAVVSTAHIRAKDGEKILRRDVPGRVAEFDPIRGEAGSPATLFHLPSPVLASTLDRKFDARISADFDELLRALTEHKFSREFRRILRSAWLQGYHYVLFDRDGAIVDGLPKFNW